MGGQFGPMRNRNPRGVCDPAVVIEDSPAWNDWWGRNSAKSKEWSKKKVASEAFHGGVRSARIGSSNNPDVIERILEDTPCPESPGVSRCQRFEGNCFECRVRLWGEKRCARSV